MAIDTPMFRILNWLSALTGGWAIKLFVWLGWLKVSGHKPPDVG
jgi:hypothetical protein